jgi:hypothetical protein
MPERKNRIDRGAESSCRGGWSRFFCLLCLFFSLPLYAADDAAYLNLINQEAMRQSAGYGVGGSAENRDFDAMESQLKEQYRGSYLFLKKLPRQSQEEIFSDYQNGASIDDIRKKIMKIFLHKE